MPSTPRHPPRNAPASSEEPGPQAPRGEARPAGARRLASHELLAGRTEVQIDHQGAVYRLRLTSLGKLILTK